MKRDTLRNEDSDAPDQGTWWRPPKTKEDRWPLVVAILIAFPMIVVFAYAMSRALDNGESLRVLATALMVTGLVVFVLAVIAFVVRKVSESRERRRQLQSGVSEPDDGHTDTWFDPNEPDGKRRPREFSVGPGLSLHERYRHSGPTPKRRI